MSFWKEKKLKGWWALLKKLYSGCLEKMLFGTFHSDANAQNSTLNWDVKSQLVPHQQSSIWSVWNIIHFKMFPTELKSVPIPTLDEMVSRRSLKSFAPFKILAKSCMSFFFSATKDAQSYSRSTTSVCTIEEYFPTFICIQYKFKNFFHNVVNLQ